MNDTSPLMTVGRVAEHLGVPLHRVEYAIVSRQVRPAGRAGNLRLFDAEGVRQIAEALESVRRRAELAK